MASYLYYFIISILINYFLVIKLFNKYNIFLDNKEKLQKFHNKPVPRAGGIGIFISFFAYAFVSYGKGNNIPLHLLLISIPVIFIGLLEDYKKDINHNVRLVFMSIGATLSIFILNTIIKNIGFLEIPLVIAIPFTIFAIVGITNAINMIDGFNGLASGIMIISLFSFIYTLLNLPEINEINIIIDIHIVLLSAILGFYILNFPFGKIFLGDGGAYFLGFIIGVLSIYIVNNFDISPWFPLLILSYPVVDVIFSIFRRIFIHNTSPFLPDKEHLHSLIYRIITKSNWKTSLYIYFIIIPFDIYAILNFNNHINLIVGFIIFIAVYIIIYIYLYKKLEY